MPHAIPVEVLLRAEAALKAAKETPVGTYMQISVWAEVMRSHRELRACLDVFLNGQTIPVAVPA